MKTENFYKRLIKPLLTVNLLFAFYNSNAQWVKLNTGLSSLTVLRDIHCIDANTCFVVGDEGLLKTGDGGNTWVKYNLANQGGGEGIFFLNKNTGFVTQGGNIQKTTDGGKSWKIKYDSNACSDATLIFFVDDSVGYVGSFYGGAYIGKTLDGGETWVCTDFYKYSKGNIRSIYFTDRNTGYVITSNYPAPLGRVLKTTDGAKTWKVVYSNLKYLYSIFFVNDSTGFVIGENSIIVKTNNGGNTWDSLNPSIPAYFESIDCINKDTCFVTGTDNNSFIIKTINGGINWQKDTTFITDTSTLRILLKSIDCPTPNICYTVGNMGMIFKYDKNTSIKTFKQKDFSYHIFPNPVTTEATIVLNSYDTRQQYSFQLFDITGREIKNISVRSNITKFNRTGLENGAYLYQIKNNTELLSSGILIIN